MEPKIIKVICAPLLVILIGFFVAVIMSDFIKEWAFIPLAITYWGMIFFIVKPTKSKIKNFFKKPTGKIGISILAFIPVLLCIVSFAWGIQYINNVLLISLWIVFAVVNGFAEEIFWRGYLFDNLSWKPIFKISYSTFLFTLSHPLMWGVFSVTVKNHMMILPLLIMGFTWSFVYSKTKSLRWCILAHVLVDLLNLSVWTFLNIYIPPII